MRRSGFWTLMNDELGPMYAASVARDLVLLELGDRTPEQALDDGLPPREIWLAVCDALDVPVERRLGKDPKPQPHR